jgi:hypothetical protein
MANNLPRLQKLTPHYPTGGDPEASSGCTVKPSVVVSTSSAGIGT